MNLDDTLPHHAAPKKLYQHLYFQVLVAIAIGAMLGFFFPSVGTKMKPFGDGFIKLIKMLIAPIIFLTVVVGIATIGDLKKLGSGPAMLRLPRTRSRQRNSHAHCCSLPPVMRNPRYPLRP